MEYDVIIIGAGPAGISASLYTVRANKKTLVLYNDISSLEKTEKIDNYYGFNNGIKGEKLYKNGIEQAKNIGARVKEEEVIKIEMNEDNNEYKFIVKTSKNKYKAKIVILATGNKRNKPKIIGIDKFEGKGISYCAICDGFFYRNKEVAVIGDGNYAISETNDLINIAKDITICTNGKKAPDFRAENVKIETREIEKIEGEDTVEEIQLKDGSKLKVDGIFVAQGVAGSVEFAKKLGALVNNNKIIVDKDMKTSIDGLYACGDCTGGLLQISKAVYEGAIAGMEASKKC